MTSERDQAIKELLDLWHDCKEDVPIFVEKLNQLESKTKQPPTQKYETLPQGMDRLLKMVDEAKQEVS